MADVIRFGKSGSPPRRVVKVSKRQKTPPRGGAQTKSSVESMIEMDTGDFLASVDTENAEWWVDENGNRVSPEESGRYPVPDTGNFRLISAEPNEEEFAAARLDHLKRVVTEGDYQVDTVSVADAILRRMRYPFD